MKYATLLIINLLLLACTGSEKNQSATEPALQATDYNLNSANKNSFDQTQKNDTLLNEASKQTSSITLHTFQNSDGRWGYDIMQADQKIIHQPVIPALSGAKGFESAKQARIIGTLAIQKIETGLMPPTLTKTEITNLLQKSHNKH